MQEEYIEFKVVRRGEIVSLKLTNVDLDLRELTDKYLEFCIAVGYHPSSVDELFS